MKRLEFGAQIKRDASARSQGVCECHRMGADIIMHFDKNCERVAREYDHIYACKLEGDATLENCAHLSKACHLVKTALDRKAMAKRDKHKINRNRPDKRGPKAKMVSRKSWGNPEYKRTVGGKVIKRNER